VVRGAISKLHSTQDLPVEFAWNGDVRQGVIQERLAPGYTLVRPALPDIGERGTNDSGPWGQPFLYQDLAHVIVPSEFYWQTVAPGQFSNGTKKQDIQELSRQLSAAGISHRLTDLVLEIKLY